MAIKNYAYINKEMLTWARSETPFSSPNDVGMRIRDISAEKLTAWEKGTDLPSISQVKKLASVYKVPLACFFLSSPPEKKIRRYIDRRTFNGSVHYETSYELWSEINRIISNREKLLEYADVEEDLIRSIPSINGNASVTEIANVLRDFLQLKLPFSSKSSYKSNAFNYFRRIIEYHGIVVAQISGVPLSEMKGLSIYYDPCSIIAVNNKDFERAKVFSMFHELAHLIRRSSSLCLIDLNERNDDEEKICDRIAAETLMPENSFRMISDKVFPLYGEWSSLCLQIIGDKFGVSSVSVLLRLKELRIISMASYQTIYKLLSAEFEEKREFIEKSRNGKNIPIHYYIKYLNRQGYLFPRIIFNAYSKGNITYGEMCRTLSVGGQHIGNMEQAVRFL